MSVTSECKLDCIDKSNKLIYRTASQISETVVQILNIYRSKLELIAEALIAAIESWIDTHVWKRCQLSTWIQSSTFLENFGGSGFCLLTINYD